MLSLEVNPRRFTIARGNQKTLFFRLRAQGGTAPQQLSIDSTVTLTAWRDHDLPAYAIDAKPCVVLDDGTIENRGRGSCTFTVSDSLAIPAGVYEIRFNVLVGGAIPLTFPDSDGQRDPDRKLLLLVTDQA